MIPPETNLEMLKYVLAPGNLSKLITTVILLKKFYTHLIDIKHIPGGTAASLFAVWPSAIAVCSSSASK